MKIDHEIRQSLEQQAAADEELLLPERGLFGMLGSAFTGSLSRWVWLTNFFALLATAVLFWTGWKFFTVSAMDERLFWGVCLILSAQVQIALKMWIFQEMNRSSLHREIKRLEILVGRQQQDH